MAEQIVIEFIADPSQLIPTVELLEKAGVVTKEDLELFNRMAAQGTKAMESVATAGKKLLPTLSQVDTSVESIADTFIDEFGKEIQSSLLKTGTNLQQFIKQLQSVGDATPLNKLQQQLASSLIKLNDFSNILTQIKQKQALEIQLKTETDPQAIASLQRQLSGSINISTDTQTVEALKLEFAETLESAQGLASEIEVLNKETGRLNEANNQAGKSQASFRSQIRQSTEALAQQLATGELTIAQIYEMSKGAGELKDAYTDAGSVIRTLGSDTFGLDATLQGVQAVAAGFQVAQGAEALFGAENEDLQKVLVKLNAVMAITSGLQQASVLLRKEEAVSLGLQVAGQKILTAANTASVTIIKALTVQRQLDVAATEEEIAANEALNVSAIKTSAGFKILRGALIGLGIAGVIVLIASLVGYFDKASKSIRNADESLKDMGDTAEDIGNNAIQGLRSDVEQLNKEIGIETPTSVDKARSALKLLDQEASDIANDQKFFSFDLSFEGIKNSFKDIASAFGLAEDRMTRNQQQQADLRKLIAEDEAKKRIKAIEDVQKSDFETTLSYSNAYYQANVDKNNRIASNDRASFAARKAAYKANADDLKRIVENDLSKDLADAGSDENKKVLARQKASNALINIDADYYDQITGLQQQQAEKGQELARQNAQALFEIKQRQLQQEADLYKSILDNEQNPYDYRLAIQQQYVEDSLALLKLQEQQELSADNLTATQRQNITDKYIAETQKVFTEGYKERNRLLQGYNKQLQQEDAASFDSIIAEQERRIQQMINNVDEAFSKIGKNNNNDKSGFAAQIQNDLNEGIITAEEAGEKLSDLDSEFQRRTLSNQKASLEAKLGNLNFLYSNQIISQQQYNDESENLQSQLNDTNRQLLDADVQNKKSAEDKKLEQTRQRIQEEQQLLNNALSFIQAGVQSLGDQFSSSISAAVLNTFSVMSDEAATTADKISAAFTAAQTVVNAAFQQSSQERKQQVDDEIKKLEERKDAELSNAELSSSQRSAIEKRYAAQEAAIKTRAAIKQRQSDIAQARINSFLAAGNALATVKPFIPAGIIAAGLALALGQFQVTNITSTPLPQFKKGTKSAPEGYAWVGEEGPEIVKFKGGEKVFTYSESKLIEKRWEKETVHDHYHKIAANIPVIPLQTVASLIPQPIEKEIIESGYKRTDVSNIKFDYDKLGKYVAKHMRGVVEDMPQTTIAYDGEDIRHIIKQGNKTDIILNKKGRVRKPNS